MSIIKWDPFRNVIGLQERINRLFEEAFPSIGEREDLSVSTWRPVVDIIARENAIVIHAELPGVKKEDISVDMKDNILTIKGERKTEKETKEENYYRRERSYGSFQRSFTLPIAVEPTSIKAKFKDGVLEVEVPKPKEKKSKQISIE